MIRRSSVSSRFSGLDHCCRIQNELNSPLQIIRYEKRVFIRRESTCRNVTFSTSKLGVFLAISTLEDSFLGFSICSVHHCVTFVTIKRFSPLNPLFSSLLGFSTVTHAVFFSNQLKSLYAIELSTQMT